jgi:hypothetical protein
MCLTSRSLVSRLVPFLLGINLHFQYEDGGFVRLKASIFDQSRKINGFNHKKGTNLGIKLLKISTCEGQNSFTLAYQSLFKSNGVLERVRPPLQWLTEAWPTCTDLCNYCILYLEVSNLTYHFQMDQNPFLVVA